MEDKPEGAYTPTEDGKVPYARKGGTNPAAQAPKTVRDSDKAYIDSKLDMFRRGHAMNVHRDQIALARKNAADNSIKRRLP